MPSRFDWDIFCSVVDNYGDIGVCWRLARQVAGEHGMRVRLWVDDLASFARINPEIDPALPAQSSRGVEVRHWLDPFPPADLAEGVADVVIEAFACHLPHAWVAAMAAREPKPVWINLEYLSAENWMRGCHGLASPQPRLPLTKHFFFPGFFAGTGGLIAESDLEARRDAFRRDAGAQAQLWSALGVPTPSPEETRVSLFSYENHAIAELLAAWAESPAPVVCLVSEGRTALQVSACFAPESSAVGTRLSRGRLEVRIVPFVEQEVYDRLLWACDCNFVRGEDSFVRAQWAARPLVWQIYPQQEDVHWHKLAAFFDLYCAGLAPDAAAALRAMWQAWNRGSGAGDAWAPFWNHRAELSAHAEDWAVRLREHADLASALAKFCGDRLK